MADTPQNPPVAVQPFPFVLQAQPARSANYREFYASGFTVRATMFDFSVIFLNLTTGAGNTIVNQEEGAVTMSLPTLKVLAKNLSASLEAIESKLGPIKVDKAMLPNDERIAALIGKFDAARLTEE